MTLFDVSDKTFIITGGAAGLGAGFAEQLLKEGAKFTALLDIAEKQGTETERRLNNTYGAGKAKFFNVDVTNDEQLFSAFDQVINVHKRIDVVINNAGIMNDNKQVYKKAIEVNYTALVTSSLKAFELMRADCGGRGGTIVNVASLIALVQIDVLPIYSGTKSAVMQFSKSLGHEARYAKTKVRVITMCYGATQTALLDNPTTLGLDEYGGLSLKALIDIRIIQTAENAALGTVEAIKRGSSGSTWVVADGQPARDVTKNIRDGFEMFLKPA